MKEKKLCIEKNIVQKEYFENKLSCSEIAAKYNINAQNVRYALKKYGFVLRGYKDSAFVKVCKRDIPKLKKWCNRCKKIKNKEMFSKNRNAGDGYDCFCKSCKQKDARLYFPNRNKKRLLLKAKLVKYKGNICFKCKTKDLPLSSYQFHHIDGTTKEKQISEMMINDKKLKDELDKCELVCANCHHQIHFGETKLSDMEVNYDIQSFG